MALQLLPDCALHRVRGAKSAALRLGQRGFGPGQRACVPYGAQLGADALADRGIGGLVEGVFGQMELAAPLGCVAEHGTAGGAQPGMVVGSDERDATQAAGDQALREAPPVGPGIRQGAGTRREPAAARPAPEAPDPGMRAALSDAGATTGRDRPIPADPIHPATGRGRDRRLGWRRREIR